MLTSWECSVEIEKKRGDLGADDIQRKERKESPVLMII